MKKLSDSNNATASKKEDLILIHVVRYILTDHQTKNIYIMNFRTPEPKHKTKVNVHDIFGTSAAFFVNNFSYVEKVLMHVREKSENVFPLVLEKI